MVATTLVLSAAVIGVVGWVLLQQTRDGLLDQRVDQVVAQSANERSEVLSRVQAVDPLESDATQQQRELADPIIKRGEAQGFSVVLAGPVEEGRGLDGSLRSTDLSLASIPPELRDRFSEVAPPARTFTRIIRDTPSGQTSEPGIITVSQFQLPADGNTYTLYFLFPLAEEAQTLGLVTRALLIAAALLLVLVAGLAWVVSRQVVAPIRMARQVAERLAAGRLQERLRVSGEDDLARLATSFNQMASNLQRQIRQLEELSRVQRRFVSDVSHELRTPLTTVRMAGDVLHDARRSFDAATARAAELLQTELDRFETLLVDLLEISRFDAGAAALDAEDLDLVDLAHRVVDSTLPLAEQRGVSVAIDAAQRPCLAEADPRRVERILRNLVTNAIDHAESAQSSVTTPRILVRIACDDEAAAVAVRDYGVGMQPGESSMVFNRFWRADPARARTSGGTGLGLSIALEDTRLHGGWLQAWGRPGQGAQFRLTLPRRAGAPLRRSPLPLVPADAPAADPVAAGT